MGIRVRLLRIRLGLLDSRQRKRPSSEGSVTTPAKRPSPQAQRRREAWAANPQLAPTAIGYLLRDVALGVRGNIERLHPRQGGGEPSQIACKVRIGVVGQLHVHGVNALIREVVGGLAAEGIDRPFREIQVLRGYRQSRAQAQPSRRRRRGPPRPGRPDCDRRSPRRTAGRPDERARARVSGSENGFVPPPPTTSPEGP